MRRRPMDCNLQSGSGFKKNAVGCRPYMRVLECELEILDCFLSNWHIMLVKGNEQHRSLDDFKIRLI
jgi:hypothetical protein